MQIKACIEEIENEIELMDALIESHKLLLDSAKISTPTQIEISATATVLHSFYNGVENIFERIAHRVDQKVPSSGFWHQELLLQMKSATSKRKAVISNELYEKLNLYLGFRHFFRHAYAFQFKWEKIKELILELPGVYLQFKKELGIFTDCLTTYASGDQELF